MIDLNLTIITLKVNGQNKTRKRQRLSDWIKEVRPNHISFKKFTSKIETQTDYKEGDGGDTSC